jgi:hypothetical protein
VKCECGSTAIIATGSDYVCAHCGLCLEPVLGGNNGHGPWQNWGATTTDRQRHPPDHAYGLLRRSCEELGLNQRVAVEAFTMYQRQRRRLNATHPPFLAPVCLFHLIRARHLAFTRQQIVASFHNPMMTQRSLFHALIWYDLPEVH